MIREWAGFERARSWCQNRSVSASHPDADGPHGSEGGSPDFTTGEPPVSAPLAERTEILRASFGLAFYAAAFGASFGAVSIASGLSVLQTMVLSLVLFSGASQFAFVGVAATGSPFAAIPAALLLGVRNSFYGVTVSQVLRPRGLAKIWTAHFFIDETTAMTISQRSDRAKRYAYWASGLAMFSLWQVGSLGGALVGTAIDTRTFGLDAAAPAVFLALLWPALRTARARWVAGVSALIALVLIPLVPPGVPVVAAAAVAVVAGVQAARTVPKSDRRPASDEVRQGDASSSDGPETPQSETSPQEEQTPENGGRS